MNNNSTTSFRFAAVYALILCFCLWSGASHAQVNIDAYRDYFLVGQFGEVCTMCEVTVLCESGTDPIAKEQIPQTGTFTVYHLQTRTFWSQIGTIWEWFISNFTADALAARGHTRPVIEYTVEEGEWSAGEVIEGRLILDPGVLEFGDYTIDRVDRSWRRADDGQAAGYCTRLPLWDALERIDANAPGGDA